jgi:hypothetical protein
MDDIFKKDLRDILRSLGLDKYPPDAQFPPAKYWWRHID